MLFMIGKTSVFADHTWVEGHEQQIIRLSKIRAIFVVLELPEIL